MTVTARLSTAGTEAGDFVDEVMGAEALLFGPCRGPHAPCPRRDANRGT